MNDSIVKKENAGKDSGPILSPEEVQTNPDNKIDEDFKSFPQAPGKDKLINPQTNNEKAVAAIDIKDGEKMDRDEINEQGSDGSGGAFESTESVQDGE